MPELELYIEQNTGDELAGRIDSMAGTFNGLCIAEFEDENCFVSSGDIKEIHKEMGEKLLKYSFFNDCGEFFHIERQAKGIFSYVTNKPSLAKSAEPQHLAYSRETTLPFYLWGTLYRGGGYFESIIPKIHEYPLPAQCTAMRVRIDVRCLVDEYGNTVFFHLCNLRGADNE